MIAGDIISEIIKRMKFWGSRFADATTSFIPNTRGNSFYLIQNRGNNLPVQIRLSNHGTYLETWTDRKELGDSVDRIDPAHSINISIVFIDNGKSITDDCESQVNCEGCALPVCKPQTFAGQNEIGRPFKVYQYVYQSDTIAPRYINALAKSIFHARHSGEYIDPLKDLPRAAKPKEFDSTNMPQQKKPQYKQTENKQYNKNRNMKQTIKLRESELKRMIAETIRSVVNENSFHRGYKAGRNLDVLHTTDGSYRDEDIFSCLAELKSKLKQAEARAKMPQYGNEGEARNYLVAAIRGLQDFINCHY